MSTDVNSYHNYAESCSTCMQGNWTTVAPLTPVHFLCRVTNIPAFHGQEWWCRPGEWLLCGTAPGDHGQEPGSVCLQELEDHGTDNALLEGTSNNPVRRTATGRGWGCTAVACTDCCYPLQHLLKPPVTLSHKRGACLAGRGKEALPKWQKPGQKCFFYSPCWESSEQQAWLTLICNNKHCGFQNLCGLFVMCCFFGFFPPGFLYSCSSTEEFLLTYLTSALQGEWFTVPV